MQIAVDLVEPVSEFFKNKPYSMKNKLSLDEEKMLWIQCYCWFYKFLSDEQKKLFISLLDSFVKEMAFVGIGISITDEIKIAIGGWAVFLVLNRPLGTNWYRHIESISIFSGKTLSPKGTLGLIKDGSHYCQIHFAWENIRDSATKATVNDNTILHEFAHSLDQINRNMDGFPEVLLSVEEQDEWKKIFCPNFIHSKTKRHRKKLWDFFELGNWNEFDPYDSSCVDVGELFAVSTEMFFECPRKLQKITPEIYNCLMKLYRCNPIIDFPKEKKGIKNLVSSIIE